MDEHLDELNPGPPTVPRPAAAVILLRRGSRHDSRGLEVLLGRRTPNARFMANVWVFPGGAVDPTGEGEPDESRYRATALRELGEEVSVHLDDPEQLVPFSRWITPVEVKIRFDTRFYLALAPPHCAPREDGEEIVEASWFAPRAALDGHAGGEMMLVFPTIKQLEALLAFQSADEALVTARERGFGSEPILPRVAVVDDEPMILLPGDAGYESADDAGGWG